jgi:diketogulonate reductase-like aldo/keto reductase
MLGFMYGTAWKEEDTRRLVVLALENGFRAIDTANQRKHYVEAAVGEALAEADIPREKLFLQTKFTHRGGQDDRLPYDPKAPVREQVKQSFESSLEHLGTTWLDSYVLHGPSVRVGLAPGDIEAWEAMEDLHAGGKAKALGISNVSAEQLRKLLERVKVKPAYVQNRCYASDGWDLDVRTICQEYGIIYQGFSLLTANRRETATPYFRGLATKLKLTPAQLVFRFAFDVGMFPLTGTSSVEHMKEDLAVLGVPKLSSAAIEAMTNVAAGP